MYNISVLRRLDTKGQRPADVWHVLAAQRRIAVAGQRWIGQCRGNNAVSRDHGV